MHQRRGQRQDSDKNDRQFLQLDAQLSQQESSYALTTGFAKKAWSSPRVKTGLVLLLIGICFMTLMPPLVQVTPETMGTCTNSDSSGVRRILIFGPTGMIGQGVLRECINDCGVEQIISVGRKPSGQTNPKLKEIQHVDFLNYDSIDEDMRNVDACFWCLGASASEVNNDQFKLINKDFPLAAANTLVKYNPNMTFIYVSGQGTDSSSSTHWAKIKGETEDELLKLPFNAYNFRIGITRAMHGETTKVTLHRVLGFFLKPIIPIVQMLSNQVATTETIGKAMLEVARVGNEKKILSVPDINNIVLKKEERK